MLPNQRLHSIVQLGTTFVQHHLIPVPVQLFVAEPAIFLRLEVEVAMVCVVVEGGGGNEEGISTPHSRRRLQVRPTAQSATVTTRCTTLDGHRFTLLSASPKTTILNVIEAREQMTYLDLKDGTLQLVPLCIDKVRCRCNLPSRREGESSGGVLLDEKKVSVASNNKGERYAHDWFKPTQPHQHV
jgi:hypothetical protein